MKCDRRVDGDEHATWEGGDQKRANQKAECSGAGQLKTWGQNYEGSRVGPFPDHSNGNRKRGNSRRLTGTRGEKIRGFAHNVHR